MAIVSILGFLKTDESLFDNFHVPDGVDKNVLVARIIAECAELEVAYSNVKTFKFILENFFLL